VTMNPSAAADAPRHADRRQQRPASPARLKEGGAKAAQKGSSSTKAITPKQGGGGGGGGRNSRGHSPVATGRERQAAAAPPVRDAVQAAGAESPTSSGRPAAADRGSAHTPDDCPRFLADASSPSRADPSRVVSDQPCASKSPKLRSRAPRGDAAPSGGRRSSGPGCGPGFWKEGCLQSELIQFHLNKSLGKRGTPTQAKTASPPASEPERSPEPEGPAPDPQPDRTPPGDFERLEDENDDLKVRHRGHREHPTRRVCLEVRGLERLASWISLRVLPD